MAKPFHPHSRWATILLILFFLSVVAGLLSLKILPVGTITQKISEKTTLLMGKIYRGIIFGVNPGEPVSSESNLLSATLVPFGAIPATGPLKQSTMNKRYFADPNGKIVYLTGSHTWSNLQDNGGSNPPPAFNYNAYLAFLQANNHNFFRLWVWEQSRWTVETSDDNYWFSPMPYQRTGPGTALDGQPKFDLTKFNQAYFDRLRNRIISARDRGIYVSIMLFDGWSIEPIKGSSNSGKNPWLGHPFNENNNIQSVNGDPNNDNNGKETHTLAVPAITNYQKAYIAKIIDTVNDLDNVLYEIANESHGGSTAWQYEMINTIHTYESANNRRKHPVGMTWQFPDGNNDALNNSPADWISPKFDRANPPEVSANTTKVFLPDTDHMGGVVGTGVPDFIWKSLTRGHNPIYMDPYDAAQYGVGAAGYNPADASFVLARKNLGYARTYAQRIQLENTIPSTTICSTGYCLVNSSPGAPKYLVYVSDNGNFNVDLSSTPIDFTQEWFNPATGLIIFGEIVSGGETKQFTPPFSGSAILYLHPYKDPNATHNYLPVVPNSPFQPMIPLSPAPQGSIQLPDQE